MSFTKSLVLALGITAVALAAVTLAHRLVAQSQILVVNSSDDDRDDRCDAAHCNLREAIRAANETRPGAVIRFALPGDPPYRISLRSGLPPISSYVSIDGAGPRGACPVPGVQIDGAAITASEVNGLEVLGDHNHVRGLAFTNFSGHGIVVRGSQNHLRCLFVGVDLTGMEPLGNAGHGIAVVGGHSNRIGGPDPEDGNLLSANLGRGLHFEDAINTYFEYNGNGVDIHGSPRLLNLNLDLPALNPPPPASVVNARAREPLMATVARRIEEIMAKNAMALEEAGLYETYIQRIREEYPGAPIPPDLASLIGELHRFPAVYADFAQDASDVLATARMEGALELVQLFRAFSRTLPELGRQVIMPSEAELDITMATLGRFPAGSLVFSGPPSNVAYAEGDMSPPLIQHLQWHSLHTFGPTSFNSTFPPADSIQTCVGALSVCQWPLTHDLMPPSSLIVWQSPTLSEQQIEDIVLENGYTLDLLLNGQHLYTGPWPGQLYDPASGQGYAAFTLPGGPCPSGMRCIGTAVVRQALKNIPHPWTFTLRVRKLEPLSMPVVIGIDGGGNLIIATEEAKLFAETSKMVQPHPTTAGQKWFVDALYETFKHPRCVDCHSFETPAGVAAHHKGGPTFIADQNVELMPSHHVPGAHIIKCTHCHTNISIVDNKGIPFSDIHWRVPYVDLDVNWGNKNAAQICNRVNTNLPTVSDKIIHFLGDARLYWAVHNPVHPYWGTLPSAPPHDWTEFKRRIGLWTMFGAPCP